MIPLYELSYNKHITKVKKANNIQYNATSKVVLKSHEVLMISHIYILKSVCSHFAISYNKYIILTKIFNDYTLLEHKLVGYVT